MADKKYTLRGWEADSGSGDTIIEALENSRVWSFERHGHPHVEIPIGKVGVTDGCDECFGAVIGPDELRTLAAELLTLADELDEEARNG